MLQNPVSFNENDIDIDIDLDLPTDADLSDNLTTQDSLTLDNKIRSINALISLNDVSLLMKQFSSVKGDTVYIDYIYFKLFANKQTYPILLQAITSSFDRVLKRFPVFNLRLNMNAITFSQVNLHRSFIFFISNFLKQRYPQKLNRCFVSNAPKVFLRVHRIISFFVDPDTLEKIHIL